MKLTIILAISLLVFSGSANAQKYEIHAYAGGFFPGKFADVIAVNKEGIYGAKGGFFITRNIEAEGSFSYINNLSFRDTLTREKAYSTEGLVSVNTNGVRKLFASFGVGAVTTTVSKDSTYFFTPALLTTDRFLSLSYGGGFKSLRQWGRFGYRAEARGRTLPHYYGFALNWFEATAGLTFAWGER